MSGAGAGRHPAVVKTYDAASRTCRVEIPGITQGGDVLPKAEIEYPIGDKSKDGPLATEIEILPGDFVWVEFIGGDVRHPVITGSRNPQAGNGVGWRRWHHANIGVAADNSITIKAGSITLEADDIAIKGNVAVSGGTLTHDGVDVGKSHLHQFVQSGASNSGPPVGGGGGGGGGSGSGIPGIAAGDGAAAGDYFAAGMAA